MRGGKGGGKKGSCPAGGTEPVEKSISEQARAEFGDTACTVFRSRGCTEFFPRDVAAASPPTPQGEGKRIPFVCVQSLQSRAIHQFAVVDEKKRGWGGGQGREKCPDCESPEGMKR